MWGASHLWSGTQPSCSSGSDTTHMRPILCLQWQTWSRVTEPSDFVKALCFNCPFCKTVMVLLALVNLYRVKIKLNRVSSI